MCKEEWEKKKRKESWQRPLPLNLDVYIQCGGEDSPIQKSRRFSPLCTGCGKEIGWSPTIASPPVKSAASVMRHGHRSCRVSGCFDQSSNDASPPVKNQPRHSRSTTTSLATGVCCVCGQGQHIIIQESVSDGFMHR